MPREISKDEIKKRTETIQTIHQEYQEKLEELKAKQNKIINKFEKELEEKKAEGRGFKKWFKKFILFFRK